MDKQQVNNVIKDIVNVTKSTFKVGWMIVVVALLYGLNKQMRIVDADLHKLHNVANEYVEQRY